MAKMRKAQREAELRAAESLAAKRRAALIALGHGGEGGRSGLVYTSTAAALLGVTPRALKQLVEPAELVKNPHYRTGPSAALYDPLDLLRVYGMPATEAARARRGGRHPKDYTVLFVRRYSTMASAIPDAAECLLSLNRYAKNPKCTPPHRAEIYVLKSDFLEVLADGGYLTGVGEHIVRKPARQLMCWACEGVGCERCEFTGSHTDLPELALHYVVLRFDIGSKQYTWHQPEKDVPRVLPAVARLEDDGKWRPREVKPISLSPGKFAEAKALIRFIIGASRRGQAARKGEGFGA